jgi:phage protein D
MSGSQVNRSSPVSLRRRFVRRCKMFVALVSGRQKKRKIRQKPESHMSSQIVHVQPLASTAKPPTSGPSTGPQTAPIPQTARPYACFWGRYISAIVAPPVASAGDPKNPVKNRNARSMPKLTAKSVGSWNKTKIAKRVISNTASHNLSNSTYSTSQCTPTVSQSAESHSSDSK